nr:MAG TPA: hypothetical protein [Caudoviricetes sp.]
MSGRNRLPNAIGKAFGRLALKMASLPLCRNPIHQLIISRVFRFVKLCII